MDVQWWCAAQGTPWTWQWQAYPGVWAFMGLLAGAWMLLRRRDSGAGEESGPGPREDPGPEHRREGGRRSWAFWTGWALLWIVLDWPVGALGASYLASVHMIQFLVIALVAPPLLLLGMPAGGYEALARRPVLHRLLAVVTHPVPALLLFGALMGLTHWPPVVDTLMATPLGSFVLDVTWLAAGLIFWWPVAAPVPERPWFGQPLKMGYLILATLVNTAPFIFLLFSRYPVYATYELAPPVAGITSREDQILAGLLMKMGGAVVLWSAVTILFGRWYVLSGRSGGDQEAVRA